MDFDQIHNLAQRYRYWSLRSTTVAGSGHPSSCLSAADLMAVLISNHFTFDIKNVDNLANDQLIFSKGHAAPLLYAIYESIGLMKQNDLLALRQFDSELEGHPTPRLASIKFATGSLGIGIGNAAGFALGMQKRGSKSRIWVLLGDGELAEGSVWETAAFASKHNLSNLVAIVDANRLGQTGETAYGHDLDVYRKRFEAFGWNAQIVDGHDIAKIDTVLANVKGQMTNDKSVKGKPRVIIAKTIKGKGISLLEDQEGWHGKALSDAEFNRVSSELGEIDLKSRIEIPAPAIQIHALGSEIALNMIECPKYEGETSVRQAVSESILDVAGRHHEITVFDGDAANSTHTKLVADALPDQFVEGYIAEQNLVAAAVGMGKAGYKTVVSTFAAFLTRAFDQLRMAAVSCADLLVVGTHVGVSIGQDGPSQMGLEDIAMARSVCGSTVISPSDAVSAYVLTQKLFEHGGIRYLRATRGDLPIIYTDADFAVGKGRTLKESGDDRVAIVATGVCVHEALNAYEQLKSKNISVRVIDMYSIKPIDEKLLHKAAMETGHIITIEDHWYQGGLGDAVLEAFAGYGKVMPKIEKLAVNEMPRSGKPSELMKHYKIDADAIVKQVRETTN